MAEATEQGGVAAVEGGNDSGRRRRRPPRVRRQSAQAVPDRARAVAAVGPADSGVALAAGVGSIRVETRGR